MLDVHVWDPIQLATMYAFCYERSKKFVTFGNILSTKYRKKLIIINLMLCVVFSAWIHLSPRDENKQYSEITSSNPENGFLLKLNQRRTRIKNSCSNVTTIEDKTFNAPRFYRVLEKLYIDEKHNITWCPVFKAASTTMMQVYAKLTGIWNQEMKYKLQNGTLQLNKIMKTALRRKKIINIQKALSSTNRMIVVRHPFERLLSAYRDKLEHKENRKYYYEKYGKRIIKLYGNPDKQIIPTFQQFLQYLAKGNYFRDEHWTPTYRLCMPCPLAYQYILKTESFNQEILQLLTFLGLKEYLPTDKLHVNHNGQTTPHISQQYFSQVSKSLLKKTYKVYQKDFELFDYSPDLYFNMTNIK